jgi:hypothetical protein
MLPILLLLADPQSNAAGITPATQTTPDAPLPPANPLPPPTGDDAAVLAPVNAMLAGLTAHDAAAIRAQLAPGGSAIVVSEGPDSATSVRHLSWDDFLTGIKPGSDRYEERLTDPIVQSDGLVAIVWSPYVFYLNGKADHCGTDQFDLVRDASGWKVVNVTWSQRGAANCTG